MTSIDNLYLVSEKKIKESIVALGGFISSGDAKDVLAIVGDVSTAAKGIKLVVNIRNWHIARKIKKFTEKEEDDLPF